MFFVNFISFDTVQCRQSLIYDFRLLKFTMIEVYNEVYNGLNTVCDNDSIQ